MANVRARSRGLGARAVVCGLVAASGCRMDPDWPDAPGTGGAGGTMAPDGESGPDAAAGTRASAASAGRELSAGRGSGEDGAAGAAASSAGGEVRAGDGGGQSSPAVCAAQRVGLEEIAEGQVRDGVQVELEAVATSQKFLLSHARSGSCLWGMFAGAAPEGGEPRGVLVVSFGEDAPAEAECASGTDGIPDSVAPGERVRVVGRFSEYLPSGCGGGVAEPQIRVERACPVVTSGPAPEVEPSALSYAVADELARGADAALVRRYAGALVRLEGLTALPAEEGEGVVGPYGVLRFAETRLEANNDIAYGDLGRGGPGAPGKSLSFPAPTKFVRMIGLIHLDYCTWSLALRDPCGDLAPPSDNCRE